MAQEYSYKLTELIKEFELTVDYMPQTQEPILVVSSEVNRPGLALSGFFQFFDESLTECFFSLFNLAHNDGVSGNATLLERRENRNQMVSTFLSGYTSREANHIFPLELRILSVPLLIPFVRGAVFGGMLRKIDRVRNHDNLLGRSCRIAFLDMLLNEVGNGHNLITLSHYGGIGIDCVATVESRDYFRTLLSRHFLECPVAYTGRQAGVQVKHIRAFLLDKLGKVSNNERQSKTLLANIHGDMSGPGVFNICHHSTTSRYDDAFVPLLYQSLTEFQYNLLHTTRCKRRK